MHWLAVWLRVAGARVALGNRYVAVLGKQGTPVSSALGPGVYFHTGGWVLSGGGLLRKVFQIMMPAMNPIASFSRSFIVVNPFLTVTSTDIPSRLFAMRCVSSPLFGAAPLAGSWAPGGGGPDCPAASAAVRATLAATAPMRLKGGPSSFFQLPSASWKYPCGLVSALNCCSLGGSPSSFQSEVSNVSASLAGSPFNSLKSFRASFSDLPTNPPPPGHSWTLYILPSFPL